MNEVAAAHRSPWFSETLQKFDCLFPDGMPLVWLGRLTGVSTDRLYGPDLMLKTLEAGLADGRKHALYGSTPQVRATLIKNLCRRFPGLKMVGMNARPDFVWVALGGVKQAEWAVRMKSRLKTRWIIPVGAAFDFLAGTKPQAPRWLQELGFEWFFRLLTEPRRLWRRYVLQIPLVLVLWVGEVVRLLSPKKTRRADSR
jgi:N-acetylglucosaminyldiphosphoundecaprenol N-acetyl-beta-D-mannosaminyltransferase